MFRGYPPPPKSDPLLKMLVFGGAAAVALVAGTAILVMYLVSPAPVTTAAAPVEARAPEISTPVETATPPPSDPSPAARKLDEIEETIARVLNRDSKAAKPAVKPAGSENLSPED